MPRTSFEFPARDGAASKLLLCAARWPIFVAAATTEKRPKASVRSFAKDRAGKVTETKSKIISLTLTADCT